MMRAEIGSYEMFTEYEITAYVEDARSPYDERTLFFGSIAITFLEIQNVLGTYVPITPILKWT